MTIQTSKQSFCIHLIAASPAASLVIPYIASNLGIEPSEAMRRLASLPTTIADRLSEPEARRLSDLLTVLGLTVRLDPDPFLQPVRRVDLSVQLVGKASVEAEFPFVAQALALPPGQVKQALSGIEGAVLRDVGPTAAESIRLKLRHRKLLRITESDPTQAPHMLFCRSRRSAVWTEARRLGLAACPFVGAAATEFNLATARHLARFAEAGDRIVNGEFLRLDLLADVERELVGSDLLNFLSTRPESRGPVTADGKMRIEADLSLTSAWQFAKDYAAIGLTVRGRIRGQIS